MSPLNALDLGVLAKVPMDLSYLFILNSDFASYYFLLLHSTLAPGLPFVCQSGLLLAMVGMYSSEVHVLVP